MESADLTTLLVPIISGVFGRMAWLAKYILNRRDENQKQIFAERNLDKQAIKDTIEELKTEVKQTSKQGTEDTSSSHRVF